MSVCLMNLSKMMKFIIDNTNKFSVKCTDLADMIDKKFPNWQEWMSTSEDYDVIINETPSEYWFKKNQWYIDNKSEDEINEIYKTCKTNALKNIRSNVTYRGKKETDEIFSSGILDPTNMTKAFVFKMSDGDLDGRKHYNNSNMKLVDLLELLKGIESNRCIHVTFEHHQRRAYGEYTVIIYPLSRNKRKVEKNKNAALLIKAINVSPMHLSDRIFGFSIKDKSYYGNSLEMKLHTSSYAHEGINQLIDIVNAFANDSDKLKKLNDLRGLGKASFSNLMKLYFLETITEKDLKYDGSYSGEVFYTIANTVIRSTVKFTMDDVRDAIEILKKKHESHLKSNRK